MVVYYTEQRKQRERQMLMEELFLKGVMVMGASKLDPGRQVGVFNPDFVSGLHAQRRETGNKIRIEYAYLPAWVELGSAHYHDAFQKQFFHEHLSFPLLPLFCIIHNHGCEYKARQIFSIGFG